MLTTVLRHVRVDLALHRLRDGTGHPLLLLHALGEHTPDAVPAAASHWPGPVWGLDFTGHGGSSVPAGGGYTPEALASDADAALEHIGPATILGRGLGAYAGLLLAGSRPRLVRGLVIVDGPGFDGGGSELQSTCVVGADTDDADPRTPDPWALLELSSDVRPADYAAEHMRQFGALSSLSPAVFVDALGRPAWVRSILEHAAAIELPTAEALSSLSSLDHDA